MNDDGMTVHEEKVEADMWVSNASRLDDVDSNKRVMFLCEVVSNKHATQWSLLCRMLQCTLQYLCYGNRSRFAHQL